MNQAKTIKKIQQLSKLNHTIEVVWLYGSRAKNTASENSDYDLAIAFNEEIIALKNNDYYCEHLASEWSVKLDTKISIININKVPTPLAYNVINEGVVIECNNDFRRHSEQQRVWSLWENYRYEYERYRK